MMPKEYLLKLSDLMGDAIRLTRPCLVGREPDGTPIDFDAVDPRSFGHSFLEQVGSDLTWTARTKYKDVSKLKELYGFHCGALISDRVKQIIESCNVPNVEFIPLSVVHHKTGEQIARWWFVNVFNWKSVFNLEKSLVEYVDFYQISRGPSKISSRFGPRQLTSYKKLEVSLNNIEDGLFLAEGPSERLWCNVFISKWLLDKINAGLSNKRKISCLHFWLDQGPRSADEITQYRYAGVERGELH